MPCHVLGDPTITNNHGAGSGYKPQAQAPYLQHHHGDDGSLGAEPGEEALELPTLGDQVAVDHDGQDAHGLHHLLQERWCRG